jgi:hypothetical protein
VAERSFVYVNLTASAVISANQNALLHGFLLNAVAATATIQFFDDITTTNPANPITGVITPGAIVVPTFVGPFDLRAYKKGLTVVIATAAANITVIFV